MRLKYLFFFILATSMMYGQNAKIYYSKTSDIPKEYVKYFTDDAIKELKKKQYYLLLINDSIKFFTPITKFKSFESVDTLISRNKKKENVYINKVKISQTATRNYYINYKKQYYVSKINYSLYNKFFDVKDTLPKYKWKILNEIDTINGMIAQKAMTHPKPNLLYEVWFTEDIPIDAGPFLLHGLPGLIIKLVVNKHVTFSLEKIVYEKNPLKIQKPKKEKKYISEEQWNQILNKNRKKSKIIKEKCSTCANNN